MLEWSYDWELLEHLPGPTKVQRNYLEDVLYLFWSGLSPTSLCSGFQMITSLHFYWLLLFLGSVSPNRQHGLLEKTGTMVSLLLDQQVLVRTSFQCRKKISCFSWWPYAHQGLVWTKIFHFYGGSDQCAIPAFHHFDFFSMRGFTRMWNLDTPRTSPHHVDSRWHNSHVNCIICEWGRVPATDEIFGKVPFGSWMLNFAWREVPR